MWLHPVWLSHTHNKYAAKSRLPEWRWHQLCLVRWSNESVRHDVDLGILEVSIARNRDFYRLNGSVCACSLGNRNIASSKPIIR
jgi:hypothetical protein